MTTNTDNQNTQSADNAQYIPQTGSLRQRLARVKTSRWIRFGIVSIIFFAWVAWLGTWWVGLFWFLLADIYLTQFIPWSGWKGIKNNALRTVMSWVDAIVYALVLVYFLFAFVGQNYQIPSSSLEKTLLTGDFLWVNKMVYGPRVPQTPLHFPLAQNMLPILDCKSYIEHPQLPYHRLKGVRNVERGDIVVFNFPAGDTVASKVPNPDYYTLVNQYGWARVNNDRENFGEIIYRPVDRRDNYVKRCVGLPGDNLQIKNGIIYINGKAQPEPENVQYFYYVQTDGSYIGEDLLDQLNVNSEDRGNSQHPNYILPLTADSKKTLESTGIVKLIERVQPDSNESLITYPIGADYGWTHCDYGPVWIPQKGKSVKLNKENLPLYERCIKNYEGNKLEVRGNQILINDKPATEYTFKMDYYWMMGDNRDNSLDSRFWGFVPEDHIVGTPMFVIISFDKDRSIFNGGIRWNRIFTGANPDKQAYNKAAK